MSGMRAMGAGVAIACAAACFGASGSAGAAKVAPVGEARPAAGDRKPPARTPAAAAVCAAPGSRDQDDMCIWVHPTAPSRSTVIASDKAAGRLFVYDLAGRTVQSVKAGRPGNIDLRYGFPLGGKKVDVIAFNERKSDQIWVYAVDAATRKLRRADDGKIDTGINYGGTLYRSRKTGKLYFLSVWRTAKQFLTGMYRSVPVRSSPFRSKRKIRSKKSGPFRSASVPKMPFHPLFLWPSHGPFQARLVRSSPNWSRPVRSAI